MAYFSYGECDADEIIIFLQRIKVTLPLLSVNRITRNLLITKSERTWN